VPEFQAPTGTFDVLPPQSARYERLIALYAQHVERAGYGLVVSPMFEDVAVFSRVGESTDVVRKEMYDFEDKGGRRIALRPEGTASVVRAFVEHHPLPPFKAWYAAPNFRYERPQKGRFRQHHQLGLEAIGSADPDVDVEVIATAWDLYKQLGISRIRLDITSLGDETCRPAYRQLLLDFLADKTLCDEHAATYTANPLRVLDCKKPACVEATADAPAQVDHLCDPCEEHFARVTQGLDALGVPHTLNRRLVRGLDYYTRTTFSFVAEALESAQNEAGGGGRYDRLVEMLGGPPTPAIGFGLGIERILLVCDAEGTFPTPEHAPQLDVFVIDTTADRAAARDITAELRRDIVATDRAFDGGSFKSQMKRALRSGARFAIVIEDTGIQLRTLVDKGEPEPLERTTLVKQIKERLQ
jgi:histidyl-tRNA synthetase